MSVYLARGASSDELSPRVSASSYRRRSSVARHQRILTASLSRAKRRRLAEPRARFVGRVLRVSLARIGPRRTGTHVPPLTVRCPALNSSFLPGRQVTRVGLFSSCRVTLPEPAKKRRFALPFCGDVSRYAPMRKNGDLWRYRHGEVW